MTQRDDICANRQCPIQPQKPLRAVIKFEVPRFSPPGEFINKAQVRDQDGKDLCCLEFKTKIQ